MALNVGDILRIKAACYSGNQLGLMVSHVIIKAVSTPAAFDPGQIARRISDVQHAAIKACLDDDAKYLGHSAKLIHPVVSDEAFSTVNEGYGTAAGDALPRQVSGIFTLTTGFPGRANRGRQYVPFPSEADNPNTATPSPVYVTAVSTLGTLFTVDLTATVVGDTCTFGWIIYRRANPGASPLVTGHIARNKWATQRRRGNYGRPNEVPFGSYP